MSGAVKLSEAASIALHAMTLLAAGPDEHVAVKDLASRLPVSEGHLAKVLQRLVKAGLVTSVRGPSGGFRLAADPEKTTLLAIYEAIEGKLEVAECMFSRRPQACGACILDDALAEANRIVHARLARTRLSQLAGAFAPAADPPVVALGRRSPASRPPTRRS